MQMRRFLAVGVVVALCGVVTAAAASAKPGRRPPPTTTTTRPSTTSTTTTTTTIPPTTTTNPGGSGGPTIGSCPVFPANNAWNTDISAAPLAANSAGYISNILAN